MEKILLGEENIPKIKLFLIVKFNVNIKISYNNKSTE